MVKLTDIDLPVIFKKQLLFKAGHWNKKWMITSDEVNKSVSNTKWDKFNRSLIFQHKDQDASAWIGTVENIVAENGKTYGDLHVYDPNAAVALKHGKAPMAVSAGIAWEDKYEQPTNFFYRNFSLVSDPGVRDKEIFVNFAVEDNSVKGYKIANFSSVVDEDEEHEKSETPAEEKKEHSAKFESMESLIKEHRRLVEVLKRGNPDELKKEAETQEKELNDYESKKKADMSTPNPPEPNIQKTDNTSYTQQMAEDVLNKKAQSMANMEKVPESQETKADEKKEANMEEEKEDEEDDDKEENFDAGAVTSASAAGSPASLSTVAPLNTNSAERRYKKEKTIMETENKLPSIDAGMLKTESKIANFEAEKPKEEAKVETPAPVPEKVVEAPKVVNASPVMDDALVDKVASRVADKLGPMFKPAPMTTQEFGGEAKDSKEDAVERLAKSLLK